MYPPNVGKNNISDCCHIKCAVRYYVSILGHKQTSKLQDYRSLSLEADTHSNIKKSQK